MHDVWSVHDDPQLPAADENHLMYLCELDHLWVINTATQTKFKQ